jgi:hypothetical protein
MALCPCWCENEDVCSINNKSTNTDNVCVHVDSHKRFFIALVAWHKGAREIFIVVVFPLF